MKVLTDFEIKRAALLKSYRSAIRLKHSLAADAEIAETIPKVEAQVDDALQRGEPLELDPSGVFGSVVDEV